MGMVYNPLEPKYYLTRQSSSFNAQNFYLNMNLRLHTSPARNPNIPGLRSFAKSVSIPRGSKITNININYTTIIELINDMGGVNDINVYAIDDVLNFPQNETLKIGFGYNDYNNYTDFFPGYYFGVQNSPNIYNNMVSLITNSEIISDDGISMIYGSSNIRKQNINPNVQLSNIDNCFATLFFETMPMSLGQNIKQSFEAICDFYKIDRTVLLNNFMTDNYTCFIIRDLNVSIQGDIVGSASNSSIDEF